MSPAVPSVSASAYPLQVAGTIAGYRLLKALGAGTMGEVWQVADRQGNLYAAKILRSKLAIKPGIVQRFRMEKDLVTGVRHQNIVEVYGPDSNPRNIWQSSWNIPMAGIWGSCLNVRKR